MGDFAEGVYESLETTGLTRQLRSLPLEARFEAIDPADAPEVLARHIADVVRRTRDDRDEPARVALVNELITQLQEEDAAVTDRLRQLVALTAVGTGSQGDHPSRHPAVRGGTAHQRA